MDLNPRTAEDEFPYCVAIVGGYRRRTGDMGGDVRAVSAQELISNRQFRLYAGDRVSV